MTLYLLFDSGGQGLKDNGLLGVFTSLDAAKEAKGDSWYYIIEVKSDTFYQSGVR